MPDPAYVRLRSGADVCADIQPDGSGFTMSGLQVKAFPVTAAAIAYAQRKVADGTLQAATVEEYNEYVVVEGTAADATVPYNEGKIRAAADTLHTALAATRKTDAQYTLVIGGGATGGTYTLTVAGQTTANIAWNADAATLQAAIVALSNVGPADVVVTGTTTKTIQFAGVLSDITVAVTANGAGLTPSGTATLVATVVGGS